MGVDDSAEQRIMSNGDKSSEVPGGGGNSQVDSLDMADGRDRLLLHSHRWPIDEKTKGRYLLALDAALGLAVKKNDQRAMVSCVRTLACLEGQNQADEHLMQKYARLDDGKPTDGVAITGAEIARKVLADAAARQDARTLTDRITDLFDDQEHDQERHVSGNGQSR